MKKKPVIRTYYPQAVFLPNGIERAVPLEQQESIGRLLPKQQQAHYDSKTLFYDLFVASNRLICIAPPFYNIGPPLAIKHKGKNLSFKLVRGHRWKGPEVIDIKIPSQWAKASQLDLEFVFKQFTIEVSCQHHKDISLTQKDLCLTSLQKDNPLIWIKDWCRWHIRVHGVQRIVLYDNGSSYWPTLGKELVEIDEEVEIILVHWPYKHGPSLDTFHNYKYTKLGTLNHFRLFFGIQTSWCINLDIDEFLYFDSPLSLKEYLESSKSLTRPCVYLAHYLFPSGQVPAEKQARFYHHRIRYKSKYWNVGDNPKYICQPDKVKQMGTHYCVPKIARDILLLPDPLAVIRLWVSGVPTRLRSILLLLKKNVVISKIWNITFYPWLIREKKLQQQRADEGRKLSFCHFRDLYTGWHGDMHEKNKDPNFMKRIQPLSSVNPAFLIEDKRVIHKAIETGVVTELEIS